MVVEISSSQLTALQNTNPFVEFCQIVHFLESTSSAEKERPETRRSPFFGCRQLIGFRRLSYASSAGQWQMSVGRAPIRQPRRQSQRPPLPPPSPKRRMPMQPAYIMQSTTDAHRLAKPPTTMTTTGASSAERERGAEERPSNAD